MFGSLQKNKKIQLTSQQKKKEVYSLVLEAHL